MFGNNPAETRMSGGGITYYLSRLASGPTRVIVIDPRYTDGSRTRRCGSRSVRDRCRAGARGGYWVDRRKPGRPAFLDKYCVGYDEKTLPEGAPLTPLQSVFSARAMTNGENAGVGLTHHRYSPIASLSLPGKSAPLNRPICQGWDLSAVRRTAS
jgi:Tat-targeted selenate reductase subunit YnfE